MPLEVGAYVVTICDDIQNKTPEILASAGFHGTRRFDAVERVENEAAMKKQSSTAEGKVNEELSFNHCRRNHI